MRKIGSQHQNLDHKVYKRLKSMILEQKLLPGEKVYQEKLANELGISRTPLVGALKKLEQEKLVTSIPRRGFYVRCFSKEEMIQIFELREALEGLAVRRAAMNISEYQIEKLKSYFKYVRISDHPEDLKRYAEEDRRFHYFLVKIAGSDLLTSILETYRIITYSYQGEFKAGLVRHPKETVQEHFALIEAMIKKDSIRSEELIREHIRRSIEKLKKDVEEEKQNPRSRQTESPR
jgi:DNA-binding GntR family transcriptional regulator